MAHVQMTWFEIIATITKLTELDEFTVEACADALGCSFEQTSSNRCFQSDMLHAPFERAEFISGTDKTILTLDFRPDSAREEFAMRRISLGRPIDIEITSPPVMDEINRKINLEWDRKYSLCHEFGNSKVWFGIEEKNSRKNLVNVSIHRVQKALSK